MTSFFKKIDKVSENPSTFSIKSKDELIKNKFIQYGSSCETEAMKIRSKLSQAPQFEWPPLDTMAIVNKFKALKDLDLAAGAPEGPHASFEPANTLKRKKHIYLHNSDMFYTGIQFDKSSRILSCLKPF